MKGCKGKGETKKEGKAREEKGKGKERAKTLWICSLKKKSSYAINYLVIVSYCYFLAKNVRMHNLKICL